MTELEEFKRWCKGANNPQAVASIERWERMTPSDKDALRERWDLEDLIKKEQQYDNSDDL